MLHPYFWECLSLVGIYSLFLFFFNIDYAKYISQVKIDVNSLQIFIVVPLVEEIIFRYFLAKELNPLVSSIGFSVIHLSIFTHIDLNFETIILNVGRCVYLFNIGYYWCLIDNWIITFVWHTGSNYILVKLVNFKIGQHKLNFDKEKHNIALLINPFRKEDIL